MQERQKAEMGTDNQKQFKYWGRPHKFRNWSHPAVRFFAEQRWQYISQILSLGQIKRALDVGCGSGFSTISANRYFPFVVGCDTSWHMLKENPVQLRIKGDASSLPFKSNSFDLVFGWEVLHHIDNPVKVLNEMTRVSKEFIIFFEPNPLNPVQLAFSYLEREHEWVRRFRKNYIMRIISESNLRLISHETVGCIFPNRTPEWMFYILRRVPFKVPVVGISHLVITRKIN